MKRMILAGLLAGFATVAPVGAATLHVGHGIDGRDLGLPQALPVDICLVDGPLSIAFPAELFSDVEFGDFAEIPLDLPAGRYDVEVRLASAGTCDGAVAIAASVFLGFGENATALAHLTEYGTPTLTKFVNDVRPLEAGMARLYARHAAAFGDVNVYPRKGHSKLLIRKLENPDQEGAVLKAGDWRVKIFPSSSWRDPAFSATLPLASQVAYFVAPTGAPAWVIDPVSGDHFVGGNSTPAAVSGYPSVSVPMGFVFGLPVALSFVGRAWSEAVLVRLAFAYEQAAGHRRPPRFLPTADLG